MNLPAANGLVTRLLGRWMTDDPETVVLEAGLEWRAGVPAGVMLFILAGVWVAVIAIHRSRRLDLTPPWRWTLGMLRAAVLTVPLLLMMQPNLAWQLERREAKTLAVVLDRSGSMSVEDGTETPPTSRWQRATTGLREALGTIDASGGAMQPRIRTYVFDEELTETPLADLPPSLPPQTGRLTAIGDALHDLSTELSGTPVAGVVLLSDGADNASTPERQPLAAGRRLARAGVPIHACLVGNERPRDASVALVAESPFAFVGDPVPIRVNVDHRELAGESVSITVFADDRMIESRDTVLPDNGDPVVQRFSVPFDQPGSQTVRAEIAPIPGELTTANNTARTDVLVVDEPLRVLYIERWPRWQFHFLRNAMLRDTLRCNPHLVLLSEDPATPEEERQTAAFPASAEELATFDVVVVGDLAPQDLSPQQWDWLHEHVVENGAGVIFIAGTMHMPTGFLDTAIGPLLPFDRAISIPEEDVRDYHPLLTTLGTHHPLMRMGFGDDPQSAWTRLPALQWYAGIADLKPGAVVLAERPGIDGEASTPLMILQRVGRGLSLFVGTDETWRWRYQVGNRYFYGFWGHAIQHVGMPHRAEAFQTVRIETPVRPVVRDRPVSVSVSIAPTDTTLALDATETLLLVADHAAGGPRLTFPVEQSADSPLIYHGAIRLPDEGEYRVFVEGYEDRGEAVIDVAAGTGAELELAYPQVNPTLMRQLADLTGGEYVTLAELPELINRLDLSPLRYRWSERVPLWDGWGLLSLLALLLTAEWVLRKWKYLP